MSEFHLPGCNTRGEFRRVFDYFDRIACLGRKEDAINEGKKAVELLPESEDAVEGPKATSGTLCVPTRVSKNSARKSSRDVANWSAL